jgi:hypothetical protein
MKKTPLNKRKIDVFHSSFDDISAICRSIFMQNTVLERLLVLNHMTEIWI